MHATISQDRLLSRSEAATFLGLSDHTLATWACTGRYDLPFVKCGRAVKYRLSDLERWIRERTATATA